jgi:FMN-dependent oxidoreductase (nitrilotriacetate monooxygenase family)
MMNLVALAIPIGAHFAGWRHSGAFPKSATSLEASIEIAKIAERGKMDSLFLADGNGVRNMTRGETFEANLPTARPGWFEPVTLYAAISQHTKHIGLVATATTTFEEPYLLARKYASLDHISRGRAGWNIVTTSESEDALNFSLTEHMPRDVRYPRAREFVDVVKGLWDSWDEDAFPEDKATGRYLDASKVHILDHKGKHFQVKGPLNISRAPQGHPVLFTAGQSEDGKELAAAQADCLFAQTANKSVAQQLYADIKGRMEKHGRSRDALKFIPGVSVWVGRSRPEVDELWEELGSLIKPSLGLDYLSKYVSMDLAGHDVDAPMPVLEGEVLGINSIRMQIGSMAAAENMTIRQTYQRVIATMGHPIFKGTATDVADQMEDWYKSKACDGFMVTTPVVPTGLANFVDLVVPELQKRGIFRKEYTGRTLRENMGLPAPKSRFS